MYLCFFVSRTNSSVGTQSYPTPPGRSAGLLDLTRPWYVRVLDSTGRISLVRASGETLKRYLVDVFEATVDISFLSE